MSRPLGSATTSRQQRLPSYYRPVRQRTPHRYSVPSVSASARSLSSAGGSADPMNGRRYQRSPSHVPCKSRRPGSRRLYAGHHLASTRAPARLIPRENREPPVLMPSDYLRRFNSDTRPRHRPGRALLARLPGPHLTHQVRLFPVAHHDGLQPTQHKAVWCPPP
jgi:hypothetical protein